MRTFIAIELPAEARVAARAYQDAWRELWSPRAVSWTRPEGFHITVRFLGEVQGRQAKEIGERLPVLAVAEPMPVAFTGPTAFPNMRKPRVLTLETEAPPGLAQFAGALDRALEGLRLEPRDKPFRAHLTLGRIRDVAAPVPEPPPFPGAIRWTAARAVLYQSILGPGGSRYEELASVELSGTTAGS